MFFSPAPFVTRASPCIFQLFLLPLLFNKCSKSHSSLFTASLFPFSSTTPQYTPLLPILSTLSPIFPPPIPSFVRPKLFARIPLPLPNPPPSPLSNPITFPPSSSPTPSLLISHPIPSHPNKRPSSPRDSTFALLQATRI